MVWSTLSEQLFIQVPACIAGFLSSLAITYGASVQQIIDWNKAKYPSIGTGRDAHTEAG